MNIEPVQEGPLSALVDSRAQRAAVLREFTEASIAAPSIPELTELYRIACENLGCEHFVVGQIGAPPLAADPLAGIPRIIASRLPGDWMDVYLDRSYYGCDPVLRHARMVATPFDWQDVPSMSAQERDFMGQARDRGLRIGITMPVHEPHGRMFCSAVATSSASLDVARVKPIFQLLAVRFHGRLSELAQAMRPPYTVHLTTRERECLQWAARGKSSWDISVLMEISEHTVNFHMRNAMRKLGTASRVYAVARGLSLGLIAL
jgi:LuxR family transcriptional regulator, quorum-sensing system regulator CciR